MPTIRVTGLLEIEDDEFDPGPNGPLTEAAFERYMDLFSSLDDVRFEED